ncbi:MAG TPA: 2-phosphosulfolactate phosphatase [Candidatus Limnocylindrales bacterium]|nr:2-phosphosulfolactate phosphatase [Candidatus Limnocylindrales bacterium]
MTDLAPSRSGRSFVIDAFPESVPRHIGRTIVAIDVIRATTFAITAIATGRRCIVARDVDDALEIRDRMGDVLLAGEVAGEQPVGFEMNNSPADLVDRQDLHRPVVMVSSSGARLMLEAGRATRRVYVACLRNVTAVVRRLLEQDTDVALIGAGSRGEFREEDQICCAWIADRLMVAGFSPGNSQTLEITERWRGSTASDIAMSNSATYLRRSGQLRDLDFIGAHVDDLGLVPSIAGNEVLDADPSSRSTRRAFASTSRS